MLYEFFGRRREGADLQSLERQDSSTTDTEEVLIFSDTKAKEGPCYPLIFSDTKAKDDGISTKQKNEERQGHSIA